MLVCEFSAKLSAKRKSMAREINRPSSTPVSLSAIVGMMVITGCDTMTHKSLIMFV